MLPSVFTLQDQEIILMDHVLLKENVLLLLYLLQFFPPALADGFSQESKWEQIFSSLQDSSQYFGWPQQCCILDGKYSSPCIKLWWLYRGHQLKLVSSLLCFNFFTVF